MNKFFLCGLLAAVLVFANGCTRSLHLEQVMVPSPDHAPGRADLEEPLVVTGLEVVLDDKWKFPVKEEVNGKMKTVQKPLFDILLAGKRVGLLTNPSGVDSDLNSTIDLFHENPDVELVRLFAPEHGIRGDIIGGERVDTGNDPKTGIPVVAVYKNKPTAADVEDLDIVVYDIQDVGATSYTYIYAMADMMAACADAGVDFLVLDRPNPVGANFTDGPVLNTLEYKSGIGRYDMAYMYGLTPGELGGLINKEFLEKPCNYQMVPMVNYTRRMRFWDTSLPWVPASIHIPGSKHAFYYSLTGIIGELRDDISIGVGYTLPFETIAAPWIDREELADAINAADIPALKARPITYRPYYATYKGDVIHGVHLYITDYYSVRPVSAQIKLMEILQELYPEQNIFSEENAGGQSAFNKALGTDDVRRWIEDGQSAEFILEQLEPRRAIFEDIRRKYRFYKGSFFYQKHKDKKTTKQQNAVPK